MYKITFTDVGPQKLNFAVDYDDPLGITDKGVAHCIKERIPGADVRCHDGKVLFCNGNKGCYVRYGSYTVQEVEG